jgi:hypothetical protein
MTARRNEGLLRAGATPQDRTRGGGTPVRRVGDVEVWSTSCGGGAPWFGPRLGEGRAACGLAQGGPACAARQTRSRPRPRHPACRSRLHDRRPERWASRPALLRLSAGRSVARSRSRQPQPMANAPAPLRLSRQPQPMANAPALGLRTRTAPDSSDPCREEHRGRLQRP